MRTNGQGNRLHEFGRVRQGRRPRPRCRTCWSTRPRALRCTPTGRRELGAARPRGRSCSSSRRSSPRSPTSTSTPSGSEAHLREAARDPRQGQGAVRGRPAPRRARRPRRSAGPAAWQPAADLDGLVAPGRGGRASPSGKTRWATTSTGLQELVLYGLKGAAAYADHALILGQEDADVYAIFHEALDFLAQAEPDGRRAARLGAEGRRGEPQGHGAARRRQHRRLRPSRCRRRSASTPVKGKASSSPATT